MWKTYDNSEDSFRLTRLTARQLFPWIMSWCTQEDLPWWSCQSSGHPRDSNCCCSVPLMYYYHLQTYLEMCRRHRRTPFLQPASPFHPAVLCPQIAEVAQRLELYCLAWPEEGRPIQTSIRGSFSLHRCSRLSPLYSYFSEQPALLYADERNLVRNLESPWCYACLKYMRRRSSYKCNIKNLAITTARS
jgi:hypothetical protein